MKNDLPVPLGKGGSHRNGKCRFCRAPLTHTFVDLGLSPLCENLISPENLDKFEAFYPLHAKVCAQCLLVQVGDYVSPEEIYSEYAYFSSYSDSWLAHARRYTDEICEFLNIGADSFVVELASNDGYLLRHFVDRQIPVLGIEPAANVAEVARENGIPTEVAFFGRETAEKVRQHHGAPDLLVGNNVLAHVPDLNDFVAGMKILLKPGGVITMEFPHLLRLIEQNQFDTIYHEHFSYFSLSTAERVFQAHRMTIFDVQELKSHGGSLRIFARHEDDDSKQVSQAVADLKNVETQAGLNDVATYSAFSQKVEETKRDLLDFLIDAKRAGKRIAGYGAPGKGNTLLNYCGIREDFLDYTVDRNAYKHGKYTTGARIPIHAPERIRETRPDFLLILPWNLKDEIIEQTQYIREWNGQWVVPIPTLTVIS
jgi:SAM-dependent methyltransferase